ncbi:hypothetical protein Sjap_013937 [Stephania japonica]|uniref:Exonuclease V n=1 Tax=Stephania japonica TaxID=461633 RepID=A0AAP0J030_9MAGN
MEEEEEEEEESVDEAPTLSTPSIPVEIITLEEMSLIDSAFAAIATLSTSSRLSIFSPRKCSSSQLLLNPSRSIDSVSIHSKRRLSDDIEDLGEKDRFGAQKKIKLPQSLLSRFRKKRGLSVTDFTASEWCEKQMEFVLFHGKPKVSQAMKAGSDRHVKLEEEVLQRVKVHIEAVEDVWAVKFINFIVGVNQLLFEGLTRELPVVGLIQGVWMVGVIDEIRLHTSESIRLPLLVDTKTRARATLPAEPQKRNGRLQLMCYKYLWDSLPTDSFPASNFYSFFGLNPNRVLSDEVRDLTAASGFPTKTFEDLVIYFSNTCSTLPASCDNLLLRYEYQGDNSLLGEDQFTYDPEWVANQMKSSLEFWLGEREANYVHDDERWKCRFCKFASLCPANTTTDGEASSSDPSSYLANSSTNVVDSSFEVWVEIKIRNRLQLYFFGMSRPLVLSFNICTTFSSYIIKILFTLKKKKKCCYIDFFSIIKWTTDGAVS